MSAEFEHVVYNSILEDGVQEMLNIVLDTLKGYSEDVRPNDEIHSRKVEKLVCGLRDILDIIDLS